MMFSNKVDISESNVEESTQNLQHCEVNNDSMLKFIQNEYSGENQKFRLSQTTNSDDDISVSTPDVSEFTMTASSTEDPLQNFKNFKKAVFSTKECLKPNPGSKMELNDEHSEIDLLYDIRKGIRTVLKNINSVNAKVQKLNEYSVEQKKFWMDEWSKAGIAFKCLKDTMLDTKDSLEELSDEIATCKMKFSELFSEKHSNIYRYMDEKFIVMKQEFEKMLNYNCTMEVEKIVSGHVLSIDRKIENALKDIQITYTSTLDRIMEIVEKGDIKNKRSHSQLIKMSNGNIVSPSPSIEGCKQIMSLPISSYGPCNRNIENGSLNNSFQRFNSSDHKEGENKFFDDLQFISKRKRNVRDMIFQKKPFSSDCIIRQSGPVYHPTLKPLGMNMKAGVTEQKQVYKSASKNDSQKSKITENINNNDDDDTASKICVRDPKQIKLEENYFESASATKITTPKAETSDYVLPPSSSKEKSSDKNYSISLISNPKKVKKLPLKQKSIYDNNKKPKENFPETVPMKKILLSQNSSSSSNDCLIIDEVIFNPPSNSCTNVRKAPRSKGKSRMGGVKSGTVPLRNKEKPTKNFTKCHWKDIKVENVNPDDNDLDTGNTFQVQG